MRVLYLHGFASSPGSRKATYFKEKLEALGIEVHVPDLNIPSFEELSIAAILTRTASLVGEGTILFGSSFGGFLALNLASLRPEIEKMILLAPASRFHPEKVGGLETWRKEGYALLHHFGSASMRRLHWAFVEEAMGVSLEFDRITCPVRMFHGERDEIIPPGEVEELAGKLSDVKLTMVDDDHGLLSSLDSIWTQVVEFLGLKGR